MNNLRKSKTVVYDLEVYPNFFSFGCIDVDSGEKSVLEISDRKNNIDPIQVLLNELRTGTMVGFNNVGFDWPILDILARPYKYQLPRLDTLSASELNKILYQKCEKIITDGNKAMSNPETHGLLRFKHRIRPTDIVCPQIDLLLIHHFDNKARMTSLKELEFNMAMDRVESLPIKPGTHLTYDEMDRTIDYMINGDCVATLEFYKKSVPNITFRQELSRKYQHDFMNHNDTKIGKDFFLMRLEQEGVNCYEWVDGPMGKTKKPLQTPCKTINLGDIIFPFISFKHPALQSLLSYMSTMTIRGTKQVFNNLPTSGLGDLKNHLNDKYLIKAFKRLGKSFPERIKSLHCTHKDFNYIFGTGGIHGSVESEMFEVDDNHLIIDIDVTSYYPSIIIENRLYPAHLDPLFVNIYQGMKKERMSYKKGTAENAILKLALNGVYGDLNNRYSAFYDPKMAMTVTVNGQLMLCMLAEQLADLTGLKLLQINTDGMTFKCLKSQLSIVKAICSHWEKLTKMKLEWANYSRMWIKDVNNYVAEYSESGKLKQKGVYDYDYESYGAWNKNFSNRVIKKAAVDTMVNGGSIEHNIRNHDDPYDFFLRAKVTGSTKLYLGDAEIQNNSRYFVASDGLPLTKLMPPLAKSPNQWRKSVVPPTKGRLVEIANNDKSLSKSRIDYDFYISESQKLIITPNVFKFAKFP